MRTFIAVFLIYAAIAHAQEIVEVECGQNAITAKIQKEVVLNAGYVNEDVHLNDESCKFDDAPGEFYQAIIAPLTACNTLYTVNDTHVQFRNTISSMDTGETYPLGVVVGAQKSQTVFSAFISCTYRIDLRVSTMFFPNITVIPIRIPDTFGIGEFKVAMSLYTDATYQIPYKQPPELQADEVLFVGVNIVDEASPDVYLLVERCWGTTNEDADSLPQYPLIDDGCPIKNKGNGQISIQQNGLAHQTLWRAPVFKFVGDNEEYTQVWLHCDLQICINKDCAPTCARKRRKRSIGGEEKYYGPDNWEDGPNIISIGPLTKFVVAETNKSINLLQLEQPRPQIIYANGLSNQQGDNTKTMMIVAGGLGALALTTIILALILVLMKLRNRPINNGFDMSGKDNKAYAT